MRRQTYLKRLLPSFVGLLLVGCKHKVEDAKPQKGDRQGKADKASAKHKASAKQWAKLLGLGKRKAKSGAFPTTLDEVVKGFEGYGKCIKRIRQRLPPDLGADLLAYHNIPDALCRTREALAKNEPRACQRVLSYGMRKGCSSMYAVYKRRPEHCPRGYPARRGRDAYCLALAMRNPALCGAAKQEEQEVRCQAILSGDADRCSNLRQHRQTVKCRAEVDRWGSIVRPAEARSTLASNR